MSPETVLTSQSGDKIKCEGDDAFFVVTAQGLSLTYQWEKDGVALTDGPRITGTTLPALSINDLVPGDAGNYKVVVTGTCGSYQSDPVNMTVNKDVTILTQPTGGSKCTGESLTLSVTTGDASNTYRWKKNGADLSDGVHYSGTSTPSLTISDLGPAQTGHLLGPGERGMQQHEQQPGAGDGSGDHGDRRSAGISDDQGRGGCQLHGERHGR